MPDSEARNGSTDRSTALSGGAPASNIRPDGQPVWNGGVEGHATGQAMD